MILKSKKNLVWLAVTILLVACGGIKLARNKARNVQVRLEEERAHLEKENREKRRLFNAQTMRIEGVRGRVFIADGTEQISGAIVFEACDKIRAQHGITVAPEDIAMWSDEKNATLILTADELYLIKDGIVLYWKLGELNSVDWERKTGGAITIGGVCYHFLVDCRKPFVEAIKKIVANCNQ